MFSVARESWCEKERKKKSPSNGSEKLLQIWDKVYFLKRGKNNVSEAVQNGRKEQTKTNKKQSKTQKILIK